MALDLSKIESLNIGGRELIMLKRKSDRKVIWQKIVDKLIKLLASNGQWQNYNYKEIKTAQGDTGTLNYRKTSGNYAVIEPFQSNEYLSSDVVGESNAVSNVIELDIADPNVSAIGGHAFCKCTSLSVASLSSIKNIGVRAFYQDSGLTSLYCPELTSVENEAFYQTNIVTLSLPKLVTMKGRAFRAIKALTYFDAPLLSNIADYGVSDNALSAINVPSIKVIAGEGLAYCNSLISADFNEIESMQAGCMRNEASMQRVKIADDNENFYLLSTDGQTKVKEGFVLIDNKNHTTIWASEKNCPTHIVLPSDVTIIGQSSLYKTALCSIYCPQVTTLNSAGFQYSSNLILIDFSDKTDTTIPTLAHINVFDHLHSVYQIKVPVALYDTWREYTNWSDVKVQPHIAAEFSEMVGSDGNTYKFTHCDLERGRGTIDGVAQYEKYASTGNYICEPFANIPALSAISSVQAFSTVDPNISALGGHCFKECVNLISVNIPYVKDILGTTFPDCTKLQTVNCPSVTNMGSLTFNGCTALTGLHVPELTSIENFVFQNCKNLSTLECSSVVEVKRQSVQGCSQLTELYMPELTAVGQQSFYGDVKLSSIYSPKLSILGNNAFYGCNNLISINLSSATTIPEYCFFQCNSLPTIDAENLNSIGKFGLFQCKKLSSINLENVISVGIQAFNYCGNISGELDLPNIEIIGNQAFGSCSHITEFDLHDVQSIGSYAFSECYRAEIFDFTDRTLDTIPTLADANAFNSCGAHASSGTYQIKVPSSMYDQWIDATNWSTISSNIVAV